MLCIYIYREREYIYRQTDRQTERDRDRGALYKLSPLKFVLVFGSKTAKEKLSGTEIQCRFDDSEICLNFRKRVGPLRNCREHIFLTIFLLECIRDQAVRPAFSNFVEVVSVFKGSHRFNRDVRNGKMLKSSTLEETQRYYRAKFRSMIVSKVMSFSVQNSAHAWQGYTGMIGKINLTLVRFWYVFH